jgi:cellulose biosynthesis protein BcsQ
VVTLEQALAIAGAAVTVTTFLVGGADWLIRSWLQKHRDELINALNTQVATQHATINRLTKERDDAHTDYAAVVQLQASTAAALVTETARANALDAAVAVRDGQLADLSDLQNALAKKQKAHDNRINRALKLQGAIWTQSVMKNPPRFVARSERKTPIVSVLNLKGGVGKTTITANLAWALADRGYHVLLIDLDLQGSLSSLFLRNEELARLSKLGGKLFQDFLAPPKLQEGEPTKRRELRNCMVEVPQLNAGCKLVAASDRLAYAELSQTVRWLLRVGGTSQTWSGRHDGRMILRKALHRHSVYHKFDVVLLDCPPLLNLCCSNALAASDSVLIPVTPSPKAIERVTPLLRRVVEIRANGVNPELNVLGIVVNRTENKAMSPREEDLFVNLPDECQKVFNAPVDRFDTVVQQRVAIQNTEDQFEPPGEGQPLRKNFEVLAQEFITRLKLGEPRSSGKRKRKGDATTSGGAT